jgi:ADP-heptose:LPS heptosyltransferase
MTLPDIDKIAVLRANAIGDFIFALPALEALRAAYPYSEIVLLAKPWHAAFIEGRPSPVDRVVVVPNYRGVREDGGLGGSDGQAPWREEQDRFFAAMQDEHFDLALQLHGGGRNSNPFVRRLGARLTAGLRTPDAEPLDLNVPYIYWQSEILRLLEVVKLAGAPAVTLEPRLGVTDADLEEAKRVVPPSEQALVALHAGVGDPRRQWPPHKFAAVGDVLARAGARLVLTGSAEERAITQQVALAMHAPVEDLSGRLSLGGLVGLLSRCKVVVSNDSGPLHVAEAVGAATVGIYWCGNLINAEPMTRTRHRPHLSWELECSICGRNCIYDNCEHRPSFVDRVTVDEVVASALELLTSPPGPLS